MHQRVLRYVDPEHLDAGTDLHQVFHEKPLGAPDIEHAVPGLQAKVLDDVLRHRNPAPVVSIATVAKLARPVEIFETVFARLCDDFRRLRCSARSNVALALWQL